jgi:nucleotide-binding universal stress UspA family protein
MTTHATSTPLPAPSDAHRRAPRTQNTAAPVVAAVDGSPASNEAIQTAVHLAATLEAPIVFVYVRRGPAGFLGWPEYQRRLTAKMRQARRALDDALLAAAAGGVRAEGEILEGAPQRRIAEFADARGAQLVVVGSRRHKLGRSVSSAIVRAARPPVVVARALNRLAPKRDTA